MQHRIGQTSMRQSALTPGLRAKLEDSTRLLHSIVSNLNGMVYCCLYDQPLTWVWVAGNCGDVTGYTADLLLADGTLGLTATIHPDDRGWVREKIDTAVCNGVPFIAEYRVVHRDGEIKWLAERGRPIYNVLGEVEAIEGILQNITRRKLSELEARRAEHRYRSIFENAIEGIYQTTPDGAYLDFNPALAGLYGYESPADMARCLCDIEQQLYVDRHKRDEFIALMHAHGRVKDFQAQIYRKDGSVIWISENAREVRDPEGTLLFYEGSVEDITERKNHEQEMEYQATHDVLTGLPNRTLLSDRLQHCMATAEREGSKVVVAFVDLDQFKLINDSMGHNAGDQLLKLMSARLVNCVRAADTVVRLGGDEFVLLLTGLQQVGDISQRMQRILSSVTEVCTIEQRDFVVSCSIGISVYPEDARDTVTLIKYADAAMYKAKQSGRNTFQFYTDELNQRLMQRLEMEQRLRQALPQQEFLLHYQPKLDFASGQVCGAEALIRWQPSGEGLISPASFIPIAEETHLIEEIGHWVLETACAQAVALHQRLGYPLPIAVNVAPRQFRRPDFVSIVAAVLASSGLEAAYLELEITESSLVHDTGSFIKTLHGLKELGVKLAIDDFGTGYSSLAYLKDFPVDRLKIDRAFVSNLEHEPSNSAILKAIVALGHSLDMKVIAEGVETAYQQTFLHDLGCDELQGYYFSKPVTLHDLEVLIQSR